MVATTSAGDVQRGDIKYENIRLLNSSLSSESLLFNDGTDSLNSDLPILLSGDESTTKSEDEILNALGYLAELQLSDLCKGKYKYDIKFANTMHALGRINLAYELWDNIVDNTNLNEKIEVCLQIRIYAIFDGRLQYANKLNERIYQILMSMKDSGYDNDIFEEIKQQIEAPLDSFKIVEDPVKDEFESRLFIIGKFLNRLPLKVRNKHTFACRTAEAHEQFLQTQAHILGTLTSKNKTDLILALNKLYNFVSGLPPQMKLIFIIVRIPQMDYFVNALLNLFPAFIGANSIKIKPFDILNYYHILKKKHQQDEFLKFWEIHCKCLLLLAVKNISLGGSNNQIAIEQLREISHLCEMLYELIKVDVQLSIKISQRESSKRKKILRKFRNFIDGFRSSIVELGLLTLYYLFVAYYRLGAHVLKDDFLKENANKIKAEACVFQSFVSLAEINQVFYNISSVECALGYVNELLAISQGQEVIPNSIISDIPELINSNRTFSKMNEFFLEKMISHNITAISNSCVDDPRIPLMFEKIIYGLIMHGGYNILTLWVTKYLMNMACLKNQSSLISYEDGQEYYTNNFLDAPFEVEPLRLITNRLYKHRMILKKNEIMHHNEDASYLLPQVLLSNNEAIVLPEYTSELKEGRTLRINLNPLSGILRFDKDIVRECNYRSMMYLQVIFNKVKIPLLKEIYQVPECKKVLDLFYRGPNQYSQDIPLTS